jgi:hypothetical protein
MGAANTKAMYECMNCGEMRQYGCVGPHQLFLEDENYDLNYKPLINCEGTCYTQTRHKYVKVIAYDGGDSIRRGRPNAWS